MFRFLVRLSRTLENGPRFLPISAEQLESRLLLSANTAEISTPTTWQWYQNVSEASLQATVISQNARVVDLQVQNTSPVTLNAALVSNTGPYASTEYWATGQTAAHVNSWLAANHARPVSVDPYVVGGQVLFATIAVANTGADAKATWWYSGETIATLAKHVTQNGARPVDLAAYMIGTTTYYADVMVKNAGADFRSWRWTYGATPATIASLLKTYNMRLIDLKSQANGRFTAIMDRNDGTASFWYTGKSASDLSALAAQDGARIFDVDGYTSNGSTVYSAILINNSNALETTVGNIIRGAKAGAVSGAYLRALDGPVLADVNGERQYEPASGIKPLVAVTALLAVQGGTAALDEPITYYFDPANPTNLTPNPDSYADTPANAVTITLQDCIGGMLQNSDNRMTYALEERFGLPAINATAAVLGMNSTIWAQTVGNFIPGNYETLSDADLLYNNVLDGSVLNPTLTTLFQTLMLNQTNYGLSKFLPVIHQEAANFLNVAVGSAAEINLTNTFAADVIWGSKAGTYYIPINSTSFEVIRSHTGYLSLPIKVNGVIRQLVYTYGVFVDQAIVAGVPPVSPGETQIENAITSSIYELSRPIIHSALLAFK